MADIGTKIRDRLKEKGLTISEFARRINTSRENVYGIFKRKTIDTGLLTEISRVLEFNFFQYYAKSNYTTFYPFDITHDETNSGIKTAKDYMQDCAVYRAEIEIIKRENAQLRELLKAKEEIIELLKSKKTG